jgi:NAD(P)-dependent dehydrogenase (short-subunit alcohol dehydrogenase family)
MTSNAAIKYALVTGGNKGIGLAICEGLLASGFEVILAARSIEKADRAIDKLSSAQVHPLVLDVADDRSIERAIADIHALEIDRLDVLVNNAGIYPDKNGIDITNIDRALLDTTMQTNTYGALRTAQACLPLLKQAPAAKIINVSSGLGAIDGLSATGASYSLSKLALNGVTIMLADALHSQGIAVYSMCPGWVKTDMGGQGASRTPAQGADTAIWLATTATLDLSGKFFRDRQEISF